MREEFIFNKNSETIDSYMTKAAGWLRAMRGDVSEVDCSVLEGLSEVELKELRDYVYILAIGEMKETAGRHGLHKCNFSSYEDDFINNFSMIILDRLHTYNDSRRLRNAEKKYKFSTFLDELSKTAIRKTFAEIHGISEYVEKKLQSVKILRKQIAREFGISESEVSPELIVERSSRSMSVSEVISLLSLATESVSMEDLSEKDGKKKGCIKEDVNTNIFDVLENDAEKVFDSFFSRLSDIEKFFVLVHVGCSAKHLKMTANQLSLDKLLIAIVKSDSKLIRNLKEGRVVVERPDRRSVKDVEPLVLENVEYVSDSLIRYQRRKAGRALATLKDVFIISDTICECGIAYFNNQWEDLEKKYL